MPILKLRIFKGQIRNIAQQAQNRNLLSFFSAYSLTICTGFIHSFLIYLHHKQALIWIPFAGTAAQVWLLFQRPASISSLLPAGQVKELFQDGIAGNTFYLSCT